jgi:hypothetical protein
MRTANCPSCGAALRFRGATSVVAVCQYCRATLVREGAKLEDIGKQAELLEDHTPLRLGAEGRHKGARFRIVGRIQYRYGAGLWSEWYALFDNGKGGWLSDANRDYTMSYLAPPSDVPPFAELKPGEVVRIAGDSYSVTNIESAEVVSGEGELPFRFMGGWKADVADLRGAGTRFATVDYSESPPLVFLGERLPFDAFGFSGLRDPKEIALPRSTARAFKCAGCGAPIEKHLATTEVVACGSCGTVTDVTRDVGQLVQRSEKNDAAARQSFMLGAEGKWRGVGYEVVGFLTREIRVEGTAYSWNEYLLHNVEQGYAWVSEYQGHYSFIRAAAEMPREMSHASGKPRRRYLGKTFVHFQKAEAKVTHLAGEFYWRVQRGDRAVCDDYVSPPFILSSEATDNEISWSAGEYVEAAALWRAFGLDSPVPKPVGVAPNQPSPHAGKVWPYWIVFALAMAAALLVQGAFIASSGETRAPGVGFSVPAGQTTRTVSPVFELGGRGALTVVIATNSTDNWLALDLQLVEADSGRAYSLRRDLGQADWGGPGRGAEYDVAEFGAVPAGRYTLAVGARAGPLPAAQAGSPRTYAGRVQLKRAPLGWSNFWLLLLFLALGPAIATARAKAFESRRWQESDYAPES